MVVTTFHVGVLILAEWRNDYRLVFVAVFFKVIKVKTSIRIFGIR